MKRFVVFQQSRLNMLVIEKLRECIKLLVKKLINEIHLEIETWLLNYSIHILGKLENIVSYRCIDYSDSVRSQ